MSYEGQLDCKICNFINDYHYYLNFVLNVEFDSSAVPKNPCLLIMLSFSLYFAYEQVGKIQVNSIVLFLKSVKFLFTLLILLKGKEEIFSMALFVIILTFLVSFFKGNFWKVCLTCFKHFTIHSSQDGVNVSGLGYTVLWL